MVSTLVWGALAGLIAQLLQKTEIAKSPASIRANLLLHQNLLPILPTSVSS